MTNKEAIKRSERAQNLFIFITANISRSSLISPPHYIY